jgi:ATP-dependent helicase HrpA
MRPVGKIAGDASAADDFRWLVEEFRVSLFAQELGTTEPVSVVRLQRALADLEGEIPTQPSPATPLSPKGIAPATTARKTTPLKSLGSLDQLFRK